MTPEQDRIVEKMGFQICEFPPDEDSCEACGQDHKQLYFTGSAESGSYWCLQCVLDAHADNEKTLREIALHEHEGHTAHCAARMMWGDGQCECEKKGIIPGAISREIAESI